MQRRVAVLGALALLAVVAAPAGADRARLRHEYVPPTFLAQFQPDPAQGAALEPGKPVPAALRRDGERLPAPGEPAADAPQFGGAPPPGRRGIPRPEEARPDRDTTQDAPLSYHAVFNPTVAPLRRNVAFDRVEDDYRLTIAPGPRTPVAVEARDPLPGRELFWGDLTLEVRRGEAAPVPSVAPDMRVLAVRPEPPVPVAFEKDGADNFYLRAEHDGPLRVVFLVDADAVYFSAPVPGNVPLGVLRGRAGTELPGHARAAAERVLARLGVSPDQPFDQGLSRLVGWFRAFEAGVPPAATDDIYVDLALGQVGVCRHRAFAFVVSARAAGVPARQVQNEAHAFAEVLAPDGRWRRVDLGGQAPSLDMTGADNHRLHTPPADPYPKPESYLEQYSGQLAGGGQGGGDGGATLSGTPPRLGGGQGGGGPGGGEVFGFSEDPGRGGVAEVPLPTVGFAPPGEDAGEPGRPVRLGLDVPPDIPAFRGEPLPEKVRGTLHDAESGAPVAGAKVQIYLLPEGGGAPVPLGRAVRTGADGRFTAELRLPSTLDLGHYRLVGASAAGSGWSPGRSDAP